MLNNISHLNDFHKTKSKGFGLSTGGGVTSDAGKSSLAPRGSTTLSVKSLGEEREQETRATIGNGTITVGVTGYTKEYAKLDTNGQLTPEQIARGYTLEEGTNHILDSSGNRIETGRLAAVGGTELGKITYGQDGTIISDTAPMPRGLNRDVGNSQETTKDMITGALDGTMTIDNRVFTSAGRSSIANDFKDLGTNIAQIGKGLRNNIIVKSIENSITDKETSLVQAAKDYIRDDGKIADIQKDKKTTAELNGETNLSPEQVRDSLNKVAEILNDGNNFQNLEIANIDGNVAGLSYIDNNGQKQTITINLANVDISKPNEIINIIAHETTNVNRHQANEKTATNRGDTVEAIWDLKNFGNENTNEIGASSQTWLAKTYMNGVSYGNSDIIQAGNQAVYNSIYVANQELGIVDFKVIKMSKDLESSPIGKHTLIVLDPNNRGHFTLEKMQERGIDTDKIKFITLENGKEIIAVSGQATSMKNGYLIADFNNEYDLKAINEYYNMGTENDKTKWYKADYDVEARLVKSDLDDTDFIYSILKNAQNYKNNTESSIIYEDSQIKQTFIVKNPINYDLLPKSCSAGYNCNSFSNSLLYYSGAANSSEYKDFKGIDVGRDKVIDSKYFIKNGTNMTIINPLIRSW